MSQVFKVARARPECSRGTRIFTGLIITNHPAFIIITVSLKQMVPDERGEKSLPGAESLRAPPYSFLRAV